MSDNKKAADAAANASLQEEMDAVMRKYDRESATRVWTGKPKIVISVVMALFSVYCIWSTLFSTAALEVRLTAFLGLIIIMGYLTYPASKKHVHANRLPWYDIVIMVIGAAAFFYYCFNYGTLIKTLTSAAKMTPFLIAVGVAGILTLAELCRRCVGVPILVVVGALLVYTFVSMLKGGQTFDQVLGRVIYTLFFGTSGVLSTPIQVCAKFIAVFIIFGAFLERTGISSFFIDLANAIAGWTSGGPAKVAVISSALCGMVSGSSVGNTVTTGSVTIPMMKRTGYKPEFAGAVEAAASTGGQIMPPIMGAAAFLMAEYMNVTYGQVTLWAILPAVLYFGGIFISVHLEAKKLGLKGIPRSELPRFKYLIRNVYLLLPLVFLIWMVTANIRSLQFSAAIAILISIAVSLVGTIRDASAEVRETKTGSVAGITAKKTGRMILESLEAGGKGSITVAVACSMADAVLPHVVSRVLPGVDVLFLDTGYHFTETVGTRDAVAATMDVTVVDVTPELSLAEQDERYGPDLWSRDPAACCRLRKVEPLARALSGYEAWATGVRREDAPTRTHTPLIGWDATHEIVKINPLAAWSMEELTGYADQHGVLINPLLYDGYPSIGCAPCTARVKPGDDPRSGRWAGFTKTECGIHL